MSLLTLLLGCGVGHGEQLQLRGAATPKTVAIPLVHADAERAATRVKALLGPGADVSADKESNTLYLRADARAVERAKGLLVRLDEPRYFYVVRLKKADPVTVAKVAGAAIALLAFLADTPRVEIVPLERNRTILLTATEVQAKCACWLIRQLDRWW